jgi:hypothetical protein
MQGDERFIFLIRLGRWFFIIGLTVSILSIGFGVGAVIYALLRGGIIAGFSTALEAAKWIFLSLLFMVLGEIIALLISIERGLNAILSELSTRQVKPAEEKESETVFDEFGIEIREGRS